MDIRRGGTFALGMIVGISSVLIALVYWPGCGEEVSSLWFCGETQDVVIASLDFIVKLTASLAWPISVFSIAVLFRQQIRHLISKIESLTALGLGVSMTAKQGMSADSDAPLGDKIAKLEPNVLRSSSVAQIEEWIQQDLMKLPKEKREEQLLTALAQTRLEAMFNLAYANIFGSQIKALRELNERGGHISRTDAEAAFEQLKIERKIFSDWTLDRYIWFLRHYGFIDEVQGDLVLSDYGKEFLAYLSRKGLSENRMN
jgi:hypothetical protein